MALVILVILLRFPDKLVPLLSLLALVFIPAFAVWATVYIIRRERETPTFPKPKREVDEDEEDEDEPQTWSSLLRRVISVVLAASAWYLYRHYVGDWPWWQKSTIFFSFSAVYVSAERLLTQLSKPLEKRLTAAETVKDMAFTAVFTGLLLTGFFLLLERYPIVGAIPAILYIAALGWGAFAEDDEDEPAAENV